MRSNCLAFRLSVAATLVGALSSPVAAETPPAVGLTLDGMTYVLSRGGLTELQIEAKRAEISPRTAHVELVGVRARLGALAGSSQQAGGLEFVCQRGSLDLEAREFRAVGGITGRMPDGRTLQAQQLRYRQDRGLVSSETPVALRDGTGIFKGGGFQYWVRENRFRLTDGARIVLGE